MTASLARLDEYQYRTNTDGVAISGHAGVFGLLGMEDLKVSSGIQRAPRGCLFTCLFIFAGFMATGDMSLTGKVR
jgi:hypothetical protein